MQKLIDRIKSGRPIAGDGAMGTMLQQHGFDASSCLESLNLTHPGFCQHISQLYIDAGAEILQTNTFGGSPIRLAEFGLEDKAEEINRTAALLVREIAGDKAWVTGSCGPCGRHLQPFGDLDSETFVASCKRQLSALVDGGMDALSIETIMDIEEAALAIRTAKEIAPEVVIMASVTLDKTQTGYKMPFGSSINDVVRRLSEEGADVIGANCGTGMESMIEIAREFRDVSTKPVLIRPNAGLPEVSDGKPVWQETPEQFAIGTRKLLEIGVNIIGGCCGTTPDHIREIRRVIDEWKDGE